MSTLYNWKQEPEAEHFALHWLDMYARENSDIQHLSKELQVHTSTRLFDWVDHLVVPSSEKQKVHEVGYVEEAPGVYIHLRAQLPRLVFGDVKGVAVSVESIADFLMVRGLHIAIEGGVYAPYRCACISTHTSVRLWVIERRGTISLIPTPSDPNAYLKALEQWKTRPRLLSNEDQAMETALKLAKELVKELGQDLAAWVVLDVERQFWQSKNTAGQLQKGRQDRLGMGWANHDHHTFRSSRARFYTLVQLFEILGFHCRERFYAGAEAGWGAQVMENPRAKLVLFLDVDLSPQELQIDFAHLPLPPLEKLGTVGLWCALHGDSILHAGMHHLEAQFLFEELVRDLKGIHMMEPFSNFPYLKQAFTEGERWNVDLNRLNDLLAQRWITPAQADKFKTEGAIGSHMENLQRREGYKGFNQKNVSTIIQKTDPRQIPPAGGV